VVKPNFNDLAITFQANMYPAMADALALDLGVTADSIRRLGIGYYPAEGCWIFPERDGMGNVIGLLRRYDNGKKYTWEGSKRGFYYESLGIRQKGEAVPEDRPRFIRVGDAGVECPICHREGDGCLVSDEDPSDPAVVICVRTADGAERSLETGAGYFHRRHPQSDYRGWPISILPVSDQPVVVTEGASDCLVGMSMGYVAVGRANATVLPKEMAGLLQGRQVILVGDRDPNGAGQRGMEATYQMLKGSCASVIKVLPPEGRGKDLRQWHPTREEFEAHVAKVGVTTDDGSVLDDASPLALTKAWLQRKHMRDGERLLHYVSGDYYRWHGGVYRKMSPEEIKCEWYEFFGEVQGKRDTADGGVKIARFIADRKFIGNINDAASAYLHIRLDDGVHEPFSIRARAPMDLARAVIFQNGILCVESARLIALTPDVFVTSTLPYEYNPGHTCPLWLWFVGDVFNGDQESVALLQEWFGYNLIASNHMQSMMFLYGVPGSGKSTVSGILEALLGRVRCCGASTKNFRTLFGPAALLNKYAAIMAESRDTAKRDIDELLQTWKAITGGDLMNVARKYRDAVDVNLFCRLTYVANDAIPFDDASQAMASRMNLLRFDNYYRKNNPDREMLRKLKAELPGIALWAIEGLKRLLANNRFTLPERSKVELAKIADLTNPVGAMLDECVERFIGDGYAEHRVECGHMYDLWKAWCEVNMSRTSLSQIGFGMKLAHMENPLRRKQVVEAGRRLYVYSGVAIRPEAADRYLKR
jgi:putative DNA primase/helicase